MRLVGPEDLPLVVDLYELTMAQAYWREGRTETAVFDLFARRLPPARGFLLACGLDLLLDALERFRFTEAQLAYLAGLGLFGDDFLRALAEVRFTGTVRAVPEGTPVFGEEPLLSVEAPVLEAQLVETLAMNVVHLQTLLASKAARVVHAAAGRPVADFGMRRMHGLDAALQGARAMYVAGVASTSHVLAGQAYGVPVSGTMAHAFVQVHSAEAEAFRSFAALYPGTTLLVDTYDTLEAVRTLVRLAAEHGDAFRVGGVRLDSGDLGVLAAGAREILDAGGLGHVRIVASGGLDERQVAALVAAGAPIDAFGVGTAMCVSDDAPALDLVYKLVAFDGADRTKLSPGKRILPGRKQVFRVEEGGRAVRDVIGTADEAGPGRPLLVQVMADGRRVAPSEPLAATRARAAREVALLPDAVRALDPAPYPVTVSPTLAARHAAVVRAWTR